MIGIESRVINDKLGRGTIVEGPLDFRAGDVVKLKNGVFLINDNSRWWYVIFDMTGKKVMITETVIYLADDESQPDCPVHDPKVVRTIWKNIISSLNHWLYKRYIKAQSRG